MNDNCPKCNRTMKRIASGYRCRKCAYFLPVKAAPEQRGEPPDSGVYNTLIEIVHTLDKYDADAKAKIQADAVDEWYGNFGRKFVTFSGAFTVGPEAKPKPQSAPTREEVMARLVAAIKRIYEQLEEKRDSRDEAMYWCFGNPISMKRKAKPYDAEIARLENEIDEMEHRYAILRDTLDEGIDDAAARDGAAAFLLDY